MRWLSVGHAPRLVVDELPQSPLPGTSSSVPPAGAQSPAWAGPPTPSVESAVLPAATPPFATRSPARRLSWHRTMNSGQRSQCPAQPAAKDRTLHPAPPSERPQVSSNEIRGARTHSVEGIDVDVPKHRLVAFTAVSGSGESSLVFDTICTAAQRRLVERFSTYARRRLPQLTRPAVDAIRNISPCIAIDQKRLGASLRSGCGDCRAWPSPASRSRRPRATGPGSRSPTGRRAAR